MAAASIVPFWMTAGLWGAAKAQVSISLQFVPPSNSGVSTTIKQTGSIPVTLNGTPYFQNLQNVPTSKTALQTGGVSTLGYCLLHNADSANYISVFGDNSGGGEVARLLPGDWNLIRLPPNGSPYVQANGAASNLEIYLLPS